MRTAAEMVQAARGAFNAGRTRPVAFRESQMSNLLSMLVENEEEILQALRKDLNKAELESLLTEVLMCRNEIHSLMASFKAWAKPEDVTMGYANTLDTATIHKDPYGVVLVISPWNYPILLSLQPLAGAISAGNSVILKPSEIAPATAELLSKKIPLYLDNDCYQVYCGGVEETQKLLAERFDYIFFTGSPQVGRIIYQAASKYLTPVTLELGGKNPLFLDDDVDMNLAIRRILWGKCINAGQTCLAPDYILCTTAVEKTFLDKSKAILKEFYGENSQTSKDYARIVSVNHMKRVMNLIDRNKVAIGGRIDMSDLYVEPTILTNVKETDPIMQEEVFGPILPIITVTDFKQAIEFINKQEKPLALYVFTNRKDTVNAMLTKTSSGGVCVNDTLMHITVPNLPFGGVGNSGMGAYHGRLTYDTFVHRKGVLMRTMGTFGEKLQRFRYPPYNNSNMKWLRTVFTPAAMDADNHAIPWYLIPFVLGTTSGWVFSWVGSYLS